MLSQYAAEVEARYKQELVQRQAARAHLLPEAPSERPRTRRRFPIVRLPRFPGLAALRVPWGLWG
jgi:hypothetical protein